MPFDTSFHSIITNRQFLKTLHDAVAQGAFHQGVCLLAKLYLHNHHLDFDEADLNRFILNNKWIFIFFRCFDMLSLDEFISVIQFDDTPITPDEAERRWESISQKHDAQITSGYLGK